GRRIHRWQIGKADGAGGAAGRSGAPESGATYAHKGCSRAARSQSRDENEYGARSSRQTCQVTAIDAVAGEVGSNALKADEEIQSCVGSR
ncbi:MAG TPA: hypothetical protein VE258_13835, partial [Ktedonobacterales bacterium]|nr:hypothetical protein [Ktedonobacterales bacterium]